MEIQIVGVDKATDEEIKALAALDVEIFPHKADLFDEKDWQYFRNIFKFFWIFADGAVAGSVHLGPNLEWKGELPSPSPGCLYAAGLGILPERRRKGLGTFAVQWQIDYAKLYGFKRIVADCRKGNTGMIRILQKNGFRIVHEISDFWIDPDEPVVVLELKL